MNPALKRPTHRRITLETVPAQTALVALTLVCGLAFRPQTSDLADRTALFALAIFALFFCWTPLIRHLQESAEQSAFVLTAAMFIVYGLAREAGPGEGFALRLAALPDDEFVLPYSAYVVVIAALGTAPYWWRQRSNWTRSIISAIAIITFFTLISFELLRRFYPVGPTEILDPLPLVPLAMKLVEYGCVVLLCHAVAAHQQTRFWALRALPGVLLLLWARHQFFAAPEESE